MHRFGFIGTTILGGLVFLLPLVVIVLIIGKALQISMVVARPFGALIPIDSVGGVALVNILAILVVVLLCYLAGWLARFASIKRKVASLENMLMVAVPGYTFAKTLVSGVAKAEDEAGKMTPVLLTLDDYKQLAFEVERTVGGHVVVFLPGAPNPWSGSVIYVSEDRVEPLDVSSHDAIQSFRVLGHGSAKVTPPGF